MAQDEIPENTIRHPEGRSMRYLSGLSRDRAFLVVSGVAWLMVYTIFDATFSLIVIAVALLLLLRPERVDARIYRAIGMFWLNMWIRLVKKGVLWDESSKKSLFANYPIPLEANDLIGTDIGLIYNARDTTDSFLVTAAGSDISALNLGSQMGRTLQHGGAVRRLSAFERYKMGFSYLTTRRPGDVGPFYDFINASAHPDVWLPPGLDKINAGREEELTDKDHREMRLAMIAADLAVIPTEHGREVTQALVVTLRRSKALQNLARETKKYDVQQAKAEKRRTKGKPERTRVLKRRDRTKKSVDETVNTDEQTASLGDDSDNSLSISEVADMAVSELKACGVQNPYVMNVGEIEELLGKTWNCVKASAFYSALNDDSIEKPVYWPRRIVVHSDYIQTDDTFHATLTITSVPKIRYPDDNRESFAANVPWYSQALVGETVRGGKEYEALNWFRQVAESIQELAGLDRGPRGQRKAGAMMDRLEQIDQSRFTQDFTVPVSVSASTLSELRQRIRDVRAHFTLIGMTVSQIRGECRQLPALLTASTGVDLL